MTPGPPIRLLLIEDDLKIRENLRNRLSRHGFVVELSTDGAEGLQRARAEHFQGIVLDVMLPALDGWEVLKALRTDGNRVPILMLTAMGDVDDCVHGLESGADDYLVKPFAFPELLARLRTILRRGATSTPDLLQIADLEIDFFRSRVRRAGKRLDLAPQEYTLLSTMARRQGEVLSRTWLIERVWNMHFDPGTNVVEVAIRRLRQKLDDPHRVKLIHTVRGLGYVLEVRDDG